MNSSDKINSKKELLKSFDVFSGLKNQTLDRLAEISEEIELTQGQTLIRSGTIETHCFLLLEGALRLLATDPFRSELFTVGKLEVGGMVGIVDLLRQGPCEAAIARRNLVYLASRLRKC